MADVRALLAAEKSARRITHHYANYTKSGVLSCTACDLSIRSEALWEGHLKSTNHRKNAARIAAGQINREYHIPTPTTTTPATATTPISAPRNLKRKIEDVDEHDALQEEREYEVDGSKKPKSRAVSAATDHVPSPGQTITATVRTEKPSNGKQVRFSAQEEDRNGPSTSSVLEQHPAEVENTGVAHVKSDIQDQDQDQNQSTSLDNATTTKTPTTDVDEDEWAAFESDITTLEAHQESESKSRPAPGSIPIQTPSATIVAAPVSAEQIRAQEVEAESERKKLRDAEIEDEKEDESRRIEEEFEVMEEMEEKIRRLKEKRESLRIPVSIDLVGGGDQVKVNGSESEDTKQNDSIPLPATGIGEGTDTTDANRVNGEEADDDDDDDDNDIDDWYS